jgi:hypothetical protein
MPNGNRCHILFLAANPEETTVLSLDEECRQIEKKIRSTDHRANIELVTKWAVRPDDLLDHLNRHRPNVVHFSGHGTESNELVLLDDHRQPKRVSKDALTRVFSTLRDDIRLIVLNACYSRPQAELLAEIIDCVVGMSSTIGDTAAAVFAAAFYRAVGYGRCVQDAFDQGIAALSLQGLSEIDIPVLHVRKGVDAAQVYLVTNGRP